MPLKNHFRHQRYTSDEPTAPWRLMNADFPAQPGTPSFTSRIENFATTTANHVDAIWFVHGTFAGNDAFGWLSQLERMIPSAGPVLKTFGKKLTDLLAGDSGNYPPAFIEWFKIPYAKHRFVWSGENTHSGRCVAAIELLDELIQRVDQEPRIMLWGHSHAGNIAALISNLIGAEPSFRDQFFELVKPLFPRKGDQPSALQRVRSALDAGDASRLQLDVVNFGAPISYGWDTSGYRRLLHIVSHLRAAKNPEWLCPVLDAGKNLRNGYQGDLVQVLGITGSDFLPWLLNQKTRSVEAKLHQFLAPDCSRRDWWARASIGMRVADEGESVLVEYEDIGSHARITLGHSVYTKPEWLAFHLQLVEDWYRNSH